MRYSHFIGLYAVGCLCWSAVVHAENLRFAANAVHAPAVSKISCALPPGVTSFIFRLATTERQPSLTFMNENPAASGKFSIAVAKERLPAKSPKWHVVEGAIHFQNKRLFALSLVGVDANYVKLTFEVEKPQGTAKPDRAAARSTLFERQVGVPQQQPGGLATR